MNIQNYLLIPRILESIVFLIIFLSLNTQYKEVPFKDRPLVHKLFLMGIFGWFLYSFLDIFIYSFAGISFNASIIVDETGYNIEYPSLFIANILRDIAITALLLEGWLYFFTPFAIYYGEKKTRTILRNPYLILFSLAFLIGIVIEDQIRVYTNGEIIVITEKFSIIMIFGYIGIILIYLIASYLFNQMLKLAIKDQTSGLDQMRIKKFSWGILLMAFSYIYWFIINLLAISFGFFDKLFIFLFLSYSLHAFWVSSGILIYKGLKKQ